MLKWRLMLTTLPFVALVVALKVVLDLGFGFPGWVDFGDMAAVLTAAAFLIGFMLTGTLSDYKESERLPSEIATTLETIDDLIAVSACKPDFDAAAARRGVATLGERVVDWLATRTGVGEVHAAMDAMNGHFQAMDLAGATAHANRSIVFMNAVRKAVGRIEVIVRTSFLQSGYALLEVMVVVVLGLLLAARFKSVVAEYTLIVCISLIYVYMLRLIKHVDDPFDCGPDLQRRGAAEVDLFPLLEFVERVRRR